jgi:hypothetical protein
MRTQRFGPWATMSVEERSNNGCLIGGCRIEGPVVKKFVSEISRRYGRDNVASDAITERVFVLKRGYEIAPDSKRLVR